jgi:hypothetical protein
MLDHDGFFVSSDEEIMDAIGIAPMSVEGEPTVRKFSFSHSSHEEFHVSYDLIGKSFRVQWVKEGIRVLDIFRESAKSLSVTSGGGTAHICVRFASSGIPGSGYRAIW